MSYTLWSVQEVEGRRVYSFEGELPSAEAARELWEAAERVAEDLSLEEGFCGRIYLFFAPTEEEDLEAGRSWFKDRFNLEYFGERAMCWKQEWWEGSPPLLWWEQASC